MEICNNQFQTTCTPCTAKLINLIYFIDASKCSNQIVKQKNNMAIATNFSREIFFLNVE